MTDRTAHEAGPFCRGCAAEYAEATERYGHPVPYAYAHGHAVGLAHGDAVRAAAQPPATVPEPLDHAPGCDVFRVGGGPRQCDCGFALWDAKRRGVYNWTPPARQHFDGDETCAACGFGKFAHECPVAPPATVPETWHEDWRDPGMDVYDAPPATVPDEGRYEYVPLLQEAMREAAELKVPGRVTVTYDDAWALWLALGKRHLGLISDEAFAALSATKAQEP